MTTIPGWEEAGDLPGGGVSAQPPIPEHIYKVWGDMAVLCPDHPEGPTWHHRTYHEPSARHPWRVRLHLFRKSHLSHLLRGR